MRELKLEKTISFTFSFMIHGFFCLHSILSHHLIVPFLGHLSKCYTTPRGMLCKMLYYIHDAYMFIGKQL